MKANVRPVHPIPCALKTLAAFNHSGSKAGQPTDIGLGLRAEEQRAAPMNQ